MSNEPIRHEIQGVPAMINTDRRVIEKVFANDNEISHIPSTGELANLEIYCHDLEELKRLRPGRVNDLLYYLRENYMIIMQGLAAWIPTRQWASHRRAKVCAWSPPTDLRRDL